MNTQFSRQKAFLLLDASYIYNIYVYTNILYMHILYTHMYINNQQVLFTHFIAYFIAQKHIKCVFCFIYTRWNCWSFSETQQKIVKGKQNKLQHWQWKFLHLKFLRFVYMYTNLHIYIFCVGILYSISQLQTHYSLLILSTNSTTTFSLLIDIIYVCLYIFFGLKFNSKYRISIKECEYIYIYMF